MSDTLTRTSAQIKRIKDERKQQHDKEKREQVHSIIFADAVTLVGKKDTHSKVFEQWQKSESDIMEKLYVTKKHVVISNEGLKSFCPIITTEQGNPVPEGYVLLVGDAFTEPYPAPAKKAESSRDESLKDESLMRKFAEILLFLGYLPEQSQHFCIHVRYVFLNKETHWGITQFSIYADKNLRQP